MGNRVSRITDGFSGRKKKETGHDPVTTSAALTDRQYNTDLYIPQVASDTAAKLPTPPAEPVPATESEQLEELFPHEEALEDAATKIQANYKGYKARKEIKELKEHTLETEQGEADQAETQDTSPVSPNVTQVSNEESSKEQEIDIDLNDPEVEAAALKIQSGFRGYKKKKTEGDEENSVAADTEEKTDVKESIKEQQEAVETPPPPPPPAAQAEDGEYTEMKATEMLPNQAEQPAKESESNEKTDDNAEKKEKVVEEEDASSKKETEKVQNAEPVPQTQGETEEVDIDLGDPDVAAAALKIQANFRGNILRKKKKVVEAKKREPEADAENEEQAAEAPTEEPAPE